MKPADQPLEWDIVTVPMTFPAENRPIIVSSVANMTYATTKEELPRLIRGIEVVLEKHQGDNVLIHTNSYSLARMLKNGLKGKYHGREVLVYYSSDWRDRILDRFKSGGGILLAASLDRGVDLAEDLCRVQIIAKCPFPALGDKQVSTRSRQGREGERWYRVQTIRKIVQATGRAVRSREDTAICYIFDSQFSKKLWKRGVRMMFPEWWREAVEVVPSREFR